MRQLWSFNSEYKLNELPKKQATMQIFISNYFGEVFKVASYLHFKQDIFMNRAFSDVVYNERSNSIGCQFVGNDANVGKVWPNIPGNNVAR